MAAAAATGTAAGTVAGSGMEAGARGGGLFGFGTAAGELFESIAQTIGWTVDEINQVLHALDKPIFSFVIPIGFGKRIVNFRVNISLLGLFGLVAFFYVLHRYWKGESTIFHEIYKAILGLIALPGAIKDGLSNLTKESGEGSVLSRSGVAPWYYWLMPGGQFAYTAQQGFLKKKDSMKGFLKPAFRD